MPNQYWDRVESVQWVDRSERSKYQVLVGEKNGKTFVNIREFYKTQYNPEWLPSRNGMSIPVDEVGSNLVEAIRESFIRAKELKLHVGGK